GTAAVMSRPRQPDPSPPPPVWICPDCQKLMRLRAIEVANGEERIKLACAAAARRRRKPTCCRSNSFQNGGFVFSLAPRTEGTREQAFGRSRGGFSCKVHCLSDARGSSSTSRPARRRTAWHSKRSPP